MMDCFSLCGCCSPTRTKKVRFKKNLFEAIEEEEDISSTAVLEEEDHFFDDEETVYFDCIMEDPLEKQLEEMLSQLTPEELEVAALTSYQYAQNSKDRHYHAQAMARRYLKSKKTVERALPCMKATIQFRKAEGVNDLRTAFEGDNAAKYSQLEDMLVSGKNFVMGYDKQGRSTFHFIPRLTRQHSLEWTLKESLYTMERAIACSQGGSVNAVIDFAGFDFFTHSPPLAVGQQFLTTLRHHYVGHFHRIFLLDAPLGFAVLWRLFENFVGTSTRQKIVVISGQEKQEVMTDYYALEEAAPWMLEGGKKDRVLDLHQYLYKTPFDRAFDE